MYECFGWYRGCTSTLADTEDLSVLWVLQGMYEYYRGYMATLVDKKGCMGTLVDTGHV